MLSTPVIQSYNERAFFHSTVSFFRDEGRTMQTGERKVSKERKAKNERLFRYTYI